jgi:hypothetical protein
VAGWGFAAGTAAVAGVFGAAGVVTDKQSANAKATTVARLKSFTFIVFSMFEFFVQAPELHRNAFIVLAACARSILGIERLSQS